jgi:aspartate carbamoyltransferase regulatory subunit
MTNTKLTDQCVDDLARIERLEIVKLDGTEISAEGVERLRLLKPKVKIEGVTRAE